MISCCHASRNPDHEGRCGKPKSCVLPDFGGLQAPRGALRLWMEIKTCFAWIAWLEVDVGDQVIVLCAIWLLDMSPWLQGAARFRSLFRIGRSLVQIGLRDQTKERSKRSRGGSSVL